MAGIIEKGSPIHNLHLSLLAADKKAANEAKAQKDAADKKAANEETVKVPERKS